MSSATIVSRRIRLGKHLPYQDRGDGTPSACQVFIQGIDRVGSCGVGGRKENSFTANFDDVWRVTANLQCGRCGLCDL